MLVVAQIRAGGSGGGGPGEREVVSDFYEFRSMLRRRSEPYHLWASCILVVVVITTIASQFPVLERKSDLEQEKLRLSLPLLRQTNTHTSALSLSYFPSAVVIPTTTLQLAGGGDPGMHGGLGGGPVQYISGQEFYVPAGEF